MTVGRGTVYFRRHPDDTEDDSMTGRVFIEQGWVTVTGGRDEDNVDFRVYGLEGESLPSHLVTGITWDQIYD